MKKAIAAKWLHLLTFETVMYTLVYMDKDTMSRTQIYLTSEQDRALKALAALSGKKQSELIREAIDQMLKQRRALEDRWYEDLEAAFGLWRDRSEEDFLEVRSEFDRR